MRFDNKVTDLCDERVGWTNERAFVARDLDLTNG
jgi:hypothetical protein